MSIEIAYKKLVLVEIKTRLKGGRVKSKVSEKSIFIKVGDDEQME